MPPSRNISSRQSKHWCFTHFNYTPDDVRAYTALGNSSATEYIVFGREICPETGTPHLQGFVTFSSRQRFRQVKTKLPGNPNIRAADGTPLQAATYCKKDNNFTEIGEVPVEPGHRSDIDSFVAWCRERTSVPPAHEVIRAFPALAVSRGIDRLMPIVEAHVNWAPLVTGQPVLRGWQDELFGKLEEPASDRTIDFYVDNDGGAGKTFFCQYCLDRLPKTQYLTVGKAGDLAHMIDESNRVFLFDAARSQMEFLQYQVLEMLKNRLVFSPKYASRMKRLAVVPHVIVFCNEHPNESKLSADRVNVVDL